MKYYKDKDGDIWKFTDDLVSSDVYDVLIKDWSGWAKGVPFETFEKNWKLRPVTETEVFIEFL